VFIRLESLWTACVCEKVLKEKKGALSSRKWFILKLFSYSSLFPPLIKSYTNCYEWSLLFCYVVRRLMIIMHIVVSDRRLIDSLGARLSDWTTRCALTSATFAATRQSTDMSHRSWSGARPRGSSSEPPGTQPQVALGLHSPSPPPLPSRRMLRFKKEEEEEEDQKKKEEKKRLDMNYERFLH